MTIHKAVIPAAGLGTRFLPATKSTPKEMLPLVDKPAIQYVVEEAVAAGLEDVLMITGRGKRALQEHTGGSVVALLEVEPEQIHLYGCASVEAFDHSELAGVDAAPGDIVRVRGLVEKPTTAEAPSNLAVIGRYVLSPAAVSYTHLRAHETVLDL